MGNEQSSDAVLDTRCPSKIKLRNADSRKGAAQRAAETVSDTPNDSSETTAQTSVTTQPDGLTGEALAKSLAVLVGLPITDVERAEAVRRLLAVGE